MKKFLSRFLLSLVVAFVFIFWFKSEGMPIVPSLKDISSTISWWALPAYIVSWVAVHFFRAMRCTYLLRPFGKIAFRKVMASCFAGFLAIMMLPLRTGEFVRPYLYKKVAGISMSIGMGTIAIERVIDGLLVSLWLTVALFLVPSTASPYIWYLRIFPMGLFTVALFTLVAIILWKDGIRRVIDRALSKFRERPRKFILHVFDGFVKGVRLLPDRMIILKFVFWTIVYWGINGFAVLILAWGCGLDLGVRGAIAIMGILAVGILIPTGPGFFGNFQAAVMIALSMFLSGEVLHSHGAVFIFFMYLCQIGITVVAGMIGLWDTKIAIGRIMVEPEAVEEWEDVP